MIEINDALKLVMEECQALPNSCFDLEALPGHRLAEELLSDVNSPPFDKAMMDGYAIQAADIEAGRRTLDVVGEITAGRHFSGIVQSGQAVQIMTGAPNPQGADAVVMVEQTARTGEQVEIQAEVKAGQNILKLGTAMKAGQAIMKPNHRIRPEDIGLLAEAGVTQAQVTPRPSLSVIATGDELVPVATRPGISQIRNSNGPMLVALAQPFCQTVSDLGIGPDSEQALSKVVEQGLKSDVLVLSGGVSAGVADLVPGVLKAAGVRPVFHKVKIKPGKPIWFGVWERSAGRKTLVFGLPGNPVSSMVCFNVFVRPALLRLAGREPQSFQRHGKLLRDHQQRTGRTTYWPVQIKATETGFSLDPLDWKGSADLVTLTYANGFAIFPGERGLFSKDETLSFIETD